MKHIYRQSSLCVSIIWLRTSHWNRFEGLLSFRWRFPPIGWSGIAQVLAWFCALLKCSSLIRWRCCWLGCCDQLLLRRTNSCVPFTSIPALSRTDCLAPSQCVPPTVSACSSHSWRSSPAVARNLASAFPCPLAPVRNVCWAIEYKEVGCFDCSSCVPWADVQVLCARRSWTLPKREG